MRALDRLRPRRLRALRSTRAAIVYAGTVLGEGVKVLEGRGRRQAADALAALDREARAAAADEIGDGTIVSTGAIVFAGSTIGARVILGDQSCVRERVDDRRRRRRRARLARRERHDRRRADEDPGRRLHHRLLDARGARLHRAVRRDDERQLHGPHREAVRQRQGPDDPPRRPRRRRRDPLPGGRDRRGGVRRRRRRRHEGRAAARASSSATRRACCATCPRTSCSRTSSRALTLLTSLSVYVPAPRVPSFTST